MDVDKVILRAVLSTLAAIGALLVFLALSLCVFFPSTMMEFSYKLGMEDTSIHFAKRAYKESDDIAYIAYATEVAIEENKTGKILSCGQKFLDDEDFERYSQAQGEGYRQLIYGQVCAAKYQSGEIDDAIELAYESLRGQFPAGNALVAVLAAALEKGDTQTVAAAEAKLQTLRPTDATEQAYLEAVLSAIS